MSEEKSTPTPEKENVSDAQEAKPKKEKNKDNEAELKSLKEEVEKAMKAIEEANDKYMRLFAEYDNYRKRSQKEKEGVYADAYSDCIGNILPILDNLDKAAESDNIEAVRKGLELTSKAFNDALAKMGIEEVETKVFDPNFHNAVLHVDDPEKGEGEIVAVFQKGYKKGDKVIRYAMVQVAN